jgi:methyl-accepting chemotaxis protein
MEELVTKRFGEEKWKEALEKAGMPKGRYFGVSDDVPDAEIMEIMKGIANAASLSMNQVMEAFGEYWSCVYAPDIYSVYFAKAKSTREFLLNLDQIHVAMTKAMKSARPPRFTYEWKSEKVLVMNYDSQRGLVALMPGLIHGLGKYFKDDPKVHVTSNMVEVQFS